LTGHLRRAVELEKRLLKFRVGGGGQPAQDVARHRCPSMAGYHPLAVPVPYYHSNVDSDEVAVMIGTFRPQWPAPVRRLTR
jgi:hypothetical protein